MVLCRVGNLALGLLAAAVLLATGAFVVAQQAKKKAAAPPAATTEKDEVDDLLDGDKGTLFRLVDIAKPAADLAPRLFWRTLPGIVAAETVPVEFRLSGEDLIQPKLGGTEGKPSRAADVYPIAGRAELKDGKYTLTPGEIPLVVKGGKVSSEHPAIETAELKVGEEVRIRCSAVRLEALTAEGVPQPIELRVDFAGKSLLRKPAAFRPLTVWLPVGLSYDSSLGSFSLSAKGQLQAKQLAKGVEASGNTLRKTVAAPAVSRPRAESVLTLVLRESKAPEAQRPRVRVFIPPHVLPGAPVWAAVSPPEYESMLGQKLDVKDFTARVIYASPAMENERLAVTVDDKGPGKELSDQARRELQVKSGGPVWLRMALPAALAGPVQVSLENKWTTGIQTAVLVAELGQGLNVVPHRWRIDYAQPETGTYNVLIGPGFAGGEAEVVVRPDNADAAREIVLGKLTLPKTAKVSDSREFQVRMQDLPAGHYLLQVRSGQAVSGRVPLRIVPWHRKSPFFVHSMSGCTACWPTTEEGLQIMQDAGLEMATATGFASALNTDLPQVNGALAARLAAANLALPDEMLLQPTGNDYFLSRMLRHELRLIDLAVVRAAGMYNEGLSYHHSYQPSVDRMVRRMQLFTQQTSDYASFWGVNYAWFPQMYGYAEGGVPTDAHVGDRNRVLGENLKAAGIEPISEEDRKWYDEHKWSDVPAEQARAEKLMLQATNYWKQANEFGWGRHNALYNAAIRDVRPGTVCTLFDNAGHDEGKRMRSQHYAMNAVCYESYTDFGDWPMSSGFVVDWSHANSPKQPVWLTTCWGASSEGKMKSLFHAFARGMEGGGVPLQSIYDLSEIARRTTGMKFLGQYGAVAAYAEPDNRVAILSRAAAQALTPRGMWNYHAVYSHLTRLGWPPVLVADEEATKDGLPEHVQALLLVQEEQPLDSALQKRLAEFQKRGGKVIVIGDSPLKVAGALELRQPVQHLWELKGFQPDSHAEMWREFLTNWREPLAKLMDEAGIERPATTDPERGFVVTLDAGDVRYAAVIADQKETHSGVFERMKSLPVSFEGADWIVRDLAKQTTLETKSENGRTTVEVELVTEPTTLLALYRKPIGALTLSIAGSNKQIALGETVRLMAESTAKSPVPVRLSLVGPDGRERAAWHEGAGHAARFVIPFHDQSGEWQLVGQELIEGTTAAATFTVSTPANSSPAMTPVADVHVVNADHVRQFAAKKSEKWIVIEPEQRHLLPLAKQLADQLKAAGVASRLWEVQPEEFDTIPVRWYPRKEDIARIKEIEAGRLIGYRENLQAYIDRTDRAHVPELGGYGEIAPPYMVGGDCILFSGGRLAESLRAVTPWMSTAHVPGIGQGRIVVCFSPFLANRDAAVLVANDSAGLEKSAAELAMLISKPTAAPLFGKLEKTLPVVAKPNPKAKSHPVARPYTNFTPIERVQKLLAAANGKAVLWLRGEQDNLAFVDEEGKVTSTAFVEGLLPETGWIDEEGRFSALAQETLATHPGWHFPTELAYDWRQIGTDGKPAGTMRVFEGPTSLLPPGHLAGFAVSSMDGLPAVAAQRGGFMFRNESGWQRYDDLPYTRRRFEAVFPRMPISAAVSPDGKFVLATLETRPPFGAFSQPPLTPSAAETVLVDLETGERLWALRNEDYQKPTYAVHGGFGAVSKGGERAAFTDYDGVIYLVDREGKTLLRQQGGPVEEHVTQRTGPLEGIGVAISHEGQTAAWAFRSKLVVAHNAQPVEIPLPGLVAAAVAAEGTLVFAATRDGTVRAFDSQGNEQWSSKAGGINPQLVAIGEHELLVANSTGELLRLDGAGQEQFRTPVAAVADKARHAVATAFEELLSPLAYREPDTLALAQEHCAAERIDLWEPQGPVQEIAGRPFITITGSLTLAAPDDLREGFAHLVYRRLEVNKSLTVKIKSGKTTESFLLDMPTPTYRVIDLPFKGPGTQVTLETDGPVQIAEFSLWSITWPSENLAYIRPAAENLAGADDLEGKKPAGGDGDDVLEELDGGNKKPKTAGKLKTVRVWWPNSDPDQIAGPWFKAPLDPTQIVDGQRFIGGKTTPFSQAQGNYQPTRGGFFTVDFGSPQPVSFVATYDRAVKQSEVCARIVPFGGGDNDALSTGDVLGAVIDNDQFWRLIPLRPQSAPQVLGVHVFKAEDKPEGLSEVEAYVEGKKKPGGKSKTEEVDDLLEK